VATTDKYYRFVRSEIGPLLPPSATRVLDVGCGVGATAAWLKSKYPACRTVGLEGNPALLPVLSRNVDEPHIVDLNGSLPDVGAPDLVLLLDILEHLIDPRAALAHIVALMAENATVIVSLPNVAHLTVAMPLLLFGRFDYADAGILDRTHLHFFYRKSAVQLIKSAGLEVQKNLSNGLDGPRTRLLNRFTFGLIRDRLTRQYLFSATRSKFGKTARIDRHTT
jgi:SAM-dependent methyltransferase